MLSIKASYAILKLESVFGFKEANEPAYFSKIHALAVFLSCALKRGGKGRRGPIKRGIKPEHKLTGDGEIFYREKERFFSSKRSVWNENVQA